MKKLPFKSFLLPAGTYDYSIWVVFSNDKKRVLKFIKKHVDKDFENDFLKNGMVVSKSGNCPVLWMPAAPRTPHEYGTLAHEVFHVVEEIMNWAHVWLGKDSEEAYCHLIGYFMREILSRSK